MNLFGVVSIVAEFIGGGIQSYARIDILTLTRIMDFPGITTFIAEVPHCVPSHHGLINYKDTEP